MTLINATTVQALSFSLYHPMSYIQQVHDTSAVVMSTMVEYWHVWLVCGAYHDRYLSHKDSADVAINVRIAEIKADHLKAVKYLVDASGRHIAHRMQLAWDASFKAYGPFSVR